MNRFVHSPSPSPACSACFMRLHVNAVIKRRQAVGKMTASRQMAISRHVGDLLGPLSASDHARVVDASVC